MKVVVDLIGLESQRHGELGRKPVGLARSQYPYHRVWLAVHPDLLPDDVAVGTEMFPEPMGKDYLVLLARLSLFRQKIAPQKKSVARRAEKSRRVGSPIDLFRLLGCGEVEAGASPGVDVHESLVLPLPLEIVARRSGVPAALDLRPH